MIKRVILAIVILSFLTLLVYYKLPERKLPSGAIITKLIVLKSKRQLLVYDNRTLIKTYTLSLGFCPIGKKQVEHDGKTPEGFYFINAKNPNSICHKNLGISYPNKNDLKNARQSGWVPGGDIKIHGLPNGKSFIGKFHRWYDWTNGCIGLTDAEIDDLYNHTPIGTPIEIRS